MSVRNKFSSSMKHKHHIIPRHMGGTDDPSNLVEVTIEEHANLHLDLYLQHGLPADYMAFCMLSGKTEEGERARRIVVSEYMKNRVVSEETKRRISVGKSKPNPKRRGILHTDKSKEKMKLSAIKNRGRKVMCVDTGQVWDSPVLASEELGIPRKQIRKAADPKQPRNKTAKGLTFKFFD